jgi:hypothetical protein
LATARGHQRRRAGQRARFKPEQYRRGAHRGGSSPITEFGQGGNYVNFGNNFARAIYLRAAPCCPPLKYS